MYDCTSKVKKNCCKISKHTDRIGSSVFYHACQHVGKLPLICRIGSGRFLCATPLKGCYLVGTLVRGVGVQHRVTLFALKVC